MEKVAITCFKNAMAVGLLTMGYAACAAELPEGTVISKDNIDKIKNDTFLGHTIASMLTEKMEWEIRTWNLKIPLEKAPEPEVDPKFLAATKKYSSQVKFDPQTREVTGYVAGLPFPDISESDPFVGDKVLWNFYYGQLLGQDSHFSDALITVNKRGFEATSTYLFERIANKNRFSEDKPVSSDPRILDKTLFVAVAPEDLKGVGTYTIRYDDVAGTPDDIWAYIKSARRIRRLSGNAWFDPVGGFDFIADDFNVINSRPSRYTQNKLLGKRWILAITNFLPVRNPAKAGTPDEWPQMLVKEPPYWNSTEKSTPREVWVIEGTPPPLHPYGKKIIYVDVKIPATYFAEIYDKKGEYWRRVTFGQRQIVGESTGNKYYGPTIFKFVDFKAEHATIGFAAKSRRDIPGQKELYWAPETLENPKLF